MIVNTDELVVWINKLIKYNNVKAFYNSSMWLKVRAEILDEQKDECQVCKGNGLYSEAVTVHHIKYLRTNPELAVTKSNLMAICSECHYDIHHKIIPKLQLNIERW